MGFPLRVDRDSVPEQEQVSVAGVLDKEGRGHRMPSPLVNKHMKEETATFHSGMDVAGADRGDFTGSQNGLWEGGPREQALCSFK